jgi:hypothetical protein
MNGDESDDGYESVAELLEDIGSDESDDEANSFNRGRLRAIRPKVPSGQGLFRSRPTGQNVTQVQLQAALARVGAQIKTNADATKAIGTRANTVNSRLDAEFAARKKETVAIKKDLSSSRMMSILPLLLTKPPELKSFTTTDETGASQTTTVTKSEYAAQDNLLPLILLMGMGGFGGGDSKSGDDSMAMMLPLVLILSTQK